MGAIPGAANRGTGGGAHAGDVEAQQPKMGAMPGAANRGTGGGAHDKGGGGDLGGGKDAVAMGGGGKDIDNGMSRQTQNKLEVDRKGALEQAVRTGFPKVPEAQSSPMFVLKRDGRKEAVHFDKITSRSVAACTPDYGKLAACIEVSNLHKNAMRSSPRQ